ncbi:MAG: NIPSNAP family protein [Polyangiales bacterium]
MVSCYLRYVIDPFKVDEFEAYARMWIPLIEKLGGTMQGYFLPHEGPNNIAVAIFSFPSLAEYEAYRAKAREDAACQAAVRYARETRCFLSCERSFMRPLFG